MNYYRPLWTCGRYNEGKKVAIMYNLLEGMSYFFEDESAYIIGAILQAGKSNAFSPETINELGYSEEEICSFLDELVSLGLLTNNNETISKESRCKIRKSHSASVQSKRSEDDDESAESLYSKACGEDYIASVMFELTYRCSEKCIHCYNPGATRNDSETSNRGKREELSLSDYKRIIDELYQIGTYRVCLSGGDPFSNKHVWDIIDYLYQKDFAIDIYTNGQGIVNSVERLAAYYPHILGISLYSNIPTVHDSITRVKGSHSKTTSVIRQCLDWGMPVKLKCCIMLNNVQSYYTVKEMAKELNLPVEFELNITDSIDGDICASRKLRLPQSIMEIVFRDKDLSYYTDEKGLQIMYKVNKEDIICSAGINAFCFTPEGFLEPCCSFPMFMGNVKDCSIKEILQNSSIYKWWKERKVKDLEECYTHDYCICCSRCVGNNYIANGNPLRPSLNNCDLAKYRFELSKRMLEGDDPLHGKTVQQCLNELKIEMPELSRMETINYRERMDKRNVQNYSL